MFIRNKLEHHATKEVADIKLKAKNCKAMDVGSLGMTVPHSADNILAE